MKSSVGVVNTVVFVVVLLVLLGVLVALLQQGQAILQLGTPEEVLRLSILPELLPSESPGSVPLATDYSGDRGDTTSTEIACGIAEAIKSDFVQFGYAARKAAIEGFPRDLPQIDPKHQLIDAKIFRITINPATGDFWKYEDMSGAPLETLKADCSDNPGKLVPCTTPYLDEKCVTGLLSNLKNGDNLLCTGVLPAKIFAGGLLQDFGNDNCGGDDKVADGTDNCKELCPGGDKNKEKNNEIKVWTAPGELKGGVTPYVSDKELDQLHDWPPEQCEEQKCTPRYMWLLLWNLANDKKEYEVQIGRIPDTVDKGTQDMAAFAKELVEPVMVKRYDPGIWEYGANIDKYNDGLRWGENDMIPASTRYLTSGQLYPELRTVWDTEVRPAGTVTLAQFIGQVEGALGKGWTGKLEDQQCIAEEDCLWQPGDVEKKNWWVASGLKVGAWRGFANVANFLDPKLYEEIQASVAFSKRYDQSVLCGSKADELKTFHVRTTLGPSDNLLPDHKYRIVFRWWSVTEDTNLKDPGCGTPGTCTACVEPNDKGLCNLHERIAIDCEGKDFISPGNNAPDGSIPAALRDKEVRRWQELRLIIIDEGGVSAPVS
jgi:hypothetical protein